MFSVLTQASIIAWYMEGYLMNPLKYVKSRADCTLPPFLILIFGMTRSESTFFVQVFNVFFCAANLPAG